MSDMTLKERRINSTRKPHRCEYCRNVIPTGNKAREYVYLDGGHCYSWYLCEGCFSLWNELGMDWVEGIGEFSDDMHEWRADLGLTKCKCGCEDTEYHYDGGRGVIGFYCYDCGTPEQTKELMTNNPDFSKCVPFAEFTLDEFIKELTNK